VLLLWEHTRRLAMLRQLGIPRRALPPVLRDTLLRPHTWSATPATLRPMPRRPQLPAPRQVVLVALDSNEKRLTLDFSGERPAM